MSVTGRCARAARASLLEVRQRGSRRRRGAGTARRATAVGAHITTFSCPYHGGRRPYHDVFPYQHLDEISTWSGVADACCVV